MLVIKHLIDLAFKKMHFLFLCKNMSFKRLPVTLFPDVK